MSRLSLFLIFQTSLAKRDNNLLVSVHFLVTVAHEMSMCDLWFYSTCYFVRVRAIIFVTIVVHVLQLELLEVH